MSIHALHALPVRRSLLALAVAAALAGTAQAATGGAPALAPVVAAEAPLHLLVIDRRVAEPQRFLAAQPGRKAVLWVEPEHDGLAALATAVARLQDVRSVQVISHGQPGRFELGNRRLDAEQLRQQHAVLQDIGRRLGRGADFVVWSCAAGAGRAGQDLVAALAATTGLDVAASTDLSGRHGDWELEIQQGRIDAAATLRPDVLADYPHALATLTVTTNADSGAGSLRATIAAASPGDTITFNAGMTVTLSSGQLEIAKNLTIDGDLDNNGTPDVTVSGGYKSRVFSITSGIVNLDGLVITQGLVAGGGGSNNSKNGDGTGGGGTDGLGGAIQNAATLSITNSTITSNFASAGGGAGGYFAQSGAGGGGGGFSTGFGGSGGTGRYSAAPTAPSAGVGGNGGGTSGGQRGGYGGAATGGVGGGAAVVGAGYTQGGKGGSATNGSLSIGGGGGGSGGFYNGGGGGNASGGIHNTGTLTITTSTITNNLGAGGGGGGGAAENYTGKGNGGAGGIGVGALWNRGGTVQMDAGTYASMGTTNAGGGGQGGTTSGIGNIAGSDGAATSKIYTTNGGTTDTNYVAAAPPTTTVATAALSADTGASSTDWITKTAAQTISGTLSATLASGEKVEVSYDNGSTWSDASTYTVGSTSWSTTTTLSGSNTFRARVTSAGGSGASLSQAYILDTTAPNVSIGLSTSSLKVGSTPTVTFTFSEAVTGFDNADITVENATLSAVSTANGGTTWTATLTPTADLEDPTNVVTVDKSGIADVAGNAGSGTTNSSNYKIDTLRPTATLALTDTTLGKGETATLTVTFSEPVSGFTNADLTIGNATLSPVSSSDGGTTWTATLTPSANVEASGNVVTLSNIGVADAFGNAGAGTTDSPTYAIDTLAPSAPSTPDMTAGTDTGDSSTDNITGDATPTFIGTAAADTTVTLYDTDGVTILGSTTANGAGKWTLTSSTLANGPHTITAKATDAGGNTSAASSGLNVTIVSVAPTVNTVTYNVRSGVLSVAGSNFVALASGSDIDASQFTLTGGSGGTYTLTDTADAELTSSTAFSLTLSATDRAAAQQLFTRNGTTSFTGTSYKADGAEGWNAGVAGTLTSSFAGKGATASAISTISSASYTVHGSGPVAPGTLTVTGTNLNNSVDTVDPTQLTLQVLNGSTLVGAHTLTTPYNPATVTVDSTTQFRVVLNATDQLFVNGLLNNAGTMSIDGFDYNLNAAAGWNTSFLFAPDGYVSTPALTNSVNVDDAAAPSITSATFNTLSQVLSVTGVDMVAFAGSDNDVRLSNLTITGAGGNIYTLTTGDVDVASQTSFTATLSNLDAAALSPLLDKDGTKAADNTTYNLAAAINWNGQVATVADTTSTLTVTTPGPTVARVVQTSGNKAYKAGETVTVKASFDQAVVVDDSGGSPRILLETGSTDQYATYVSGSGSADLVFAYAVQAGDTSADLQYFDTSAFELNGSTIVSVANGTNAALTLPGFGSGNSLADTSAVVIDTTAPAVPSTPDLIAASDTGSSSTDNLTGDTTPTFTGTAEALATVTLYDTDGVTLIGSAAADAGGTWSITSAPLGNGPHSVSARAADAIGNLSAASAALTVTIDALAPTATLALADTALRIGETTTLTVTFSEPVSGFTTADLTVANGILSSLSSVDGGTTWTATFTPSAGVQDATNVITLDNAGVIDALGNAGSGTTDSANYAVDTRRPTVTIALSDTALAIGETATVTFTFSEPVSGFTAADALVDNGTLSALSSADGGTTWTATLTPDSGVTSATNVVTVDTTGVVDAAGNPGSGSTDSANYTIDSQRPTATLSLSDTDLVSGETATLTLTFSEAVTGVTAGDLTVENGTVSAPATTDGGITWTATFTPTSGVQDATNVITLDNTDVSDLAGNSGSGSTVSPNYRIDTSAQTATITLSDTALKVGDTALVTTTFSEAVLGFTNADLTVENGTLTAVASTDGGITWTATFTPSVDVEDASNVITLDNTGVTDASSNPGTGTTSSGNYAIDTRRPTASLTLSDTALTSGETATLTLTFSEAVTGLTAADLTAENGTLSAPSTADGGVTWTATFTPSSGVTDASNVITLDTSGVSDAAGNAGSGVTSSANYTVDTSAQTATITLNDTALRSGETALVTITFSEAVLGFSNADLTVENGTLSAVASTDGGITWTATFTPTANIEDASNLITLDNAGVTDTSGNPGTGTTSSANFAIDTRAPTATVTVADSALTRGESSAVSVVFSEVVSGFDASDLSVSNGTLSAFTSPDGGRSYTATFTPQGNLVVASTTLRLTLAGVVDLAGNPGAGTVDSNAFSIDTTGVPDAPTAVTGVAGNQQISVSWTAPTETGGSPLLDYTATATPQPPAKGVAGQCTSSAPATTCTITGLANGTRYQLGVTARTQSGSSSAGIAAATVTPFGPPQPPTNIQVVISGASAAVSWTAPANTGGLPITGYTVTTSPGGFTCSVTGNPPPTACTIANLPTGTYTFTVVATNAGGAVGAPGTAAGSTAPTAPQVIPVASPWGLGGLGLLTALLGVFGLRRRDRATGDGR